MYLKFLAYCVPATLCVVTGANATELPKRQSGLWAFESPDNPFINGSLCVDDTNTHFIDTDVWKGFEQECKTTDSVTDRAAGELRATCHSPATGETKLTLTYDGDFQTRYRYAFVALFTGINGKEDSSSSIVEATFQGECPDDMKPGSRKLRLRPEQ
ncbi:hypothetical protein [Agrobacterium tumefaciens]|uniref:DUF3617 family protein n=1 Tax=Agrobacterium tumefaciens TaxID=358 RepID=A0A4D7YQH8_AGRTU|nr:hypothetical protein [Agrobacterium tumefaciens]QCL97957.1 hypothetical protein CFBP7129_27740 [Agrobacterium tumefaciens]